VNPCINYTTALYWSVARRPGSAPEGMAWCCRHNSSKGAFLLLENFTPNGIRWSRCKDCRQKDRQQEQKDCKTRWENVPAALRGLGKTHKTCSGCKMRLPLTALFFFLADSAPDGFTRYCQLCTNEKTLEWQHNNPDRVRDIQRVCRAKNPEKYRKLFSERKAQHIKQRDSLPGKWAPKSPPYQAIKRQQSGNCYYCPFNLGQSFDHKIAIWREGATNHPDNIVWACLQCQGSKGDQLVTEWEYRWYEQPNLHKRLLRKYLRPEFYYLLDQQEEDSPTNCLPQEPAAP
jgi:hypothetical protein